MSEPTASTFDVWFTKTNQVLTKVPYNVVTDWLSQGKLGVADRVRPSGPGEFATVADSPDLADYVPRDEPGRPQDLAEALEPLDSELALAREKEEDDDDPDMIPLIDVSLVLLIFFMMTTAVSSLTPVNVPETFSGSDEKSEVFEFRVEFEPKSKEKVTYNLIPPGGAPDAVGVPTPDAVIGRFKEKLKTHKGPIRVCIAADGDVPSRATAGLIEALEKLRQNNVDIEVVEYEISKVSR